MKSALRSMTQAIADASTDDRNEKCIQLINHELFRDVRPSREDYRARIQAKGSLGEIDAAESERKMANYKQRASLNRKKRLAAAGVEDHDSVRRRKSRRQASTQIFIYTWNPFKVHCFSSKRRSFANKTRVSIYIYINMHHTSKNHYLFHDIIVIIISISCII